MYQVIIQYFEERFASFFVEEPIQEYKDLLNRVKKAIPVLRDIKDDEIKISYKDIQLGTFINIDPSEYSGNLHLSEAFRNTTSTGSDVHRRVHLQVRETDSPFILKKRASRSVTNTATGQSSESVNTEKDTGKTAKCLLPTFTNNPEKSELLEDTSWKSSKKAQISAKLQALTDQKLAIETHIKELELDVVEPPRVGTYNIICGNCHIRGHRSEGNQRNGSCRAPPCTSYYHCGQKKKHKEHLEEIKKRKKELKEINRDIDDITAEKKNLDAFQSKSISAFSTAVTPRLLKAFGDKYSPRTAKGKLELQRDIATLRLACNNKIPPCSENERDMFSSLLQHQRNVMGTDELGESSAMQSVDVINNNTAAFAGTSKTVTANTVNQVKLTVSPARNSRKKTSKTKMSSSDDSSSESSSTSDSSLERKCKRRKKKNKKYSKKKRKSTRKRMRQRTSSSSDSECDYTKNRHARKQQAIYERFGPPNDKQNGENATQSAPHTSEQVKPETKQTTLPSHNCSLEELAVIAMAIDTNRK